MSKFSSYYDDLANLISNADIVGVVNSYATPIDEQFKHISEEDLAILYRAALTYRIIPTRY